jgi:hypothetical protein
MANKLVKDIVNKIQEISDNLKLNPYELPKAQFLELSGVSPWQLRSVGGYQTLLSTYFPFVDKDLKEVQLLKARKAYVDSLEKKFGSWQLFADQLTDSLVKNLKKIKVEPVVLDAKTTQDYIKGVATKELHDGTPRSLCMALTDVHFGTFVDKEELGGKNEFNWEIAARRFGFIMDQLVTYKIEQRSLHEEVVFLLGGDLIGGIIHNQEGPDYDLITHQVNGALSYFIQGFEYVKNVFPKIRIICQPGNHGRMMHKADKGRALSQKYDSFENIIFYSLAKYFSKDPKVEVVVPKSPYAEIRIQKHRVFLTHSDGTFIVGNPGKSINTERIEVQAHRVNEEERNHHRKPFSLFVVGHVHQAAHFMTNSGIQVLINGSMIGTDSYAQGVGVMSNNPVQIMWETNSKFVVGDSRWLFVSEADKEKKYEKIIKVFNHELC